MSGWLIPSFLSSGTLFGKHIQQQQQQQQLGASPIQGAAKKWTPKVSRCFLSNRLEV